MKKFTVIMIGFLSVIGSYAAEHRALVVRGETYVLQGEAPAPLIAGAALPPEFNIRTGPAGQAQIRLADGHSLTLYPNSEIKWSTEPVKKLELVAGGINLLTHKGTSLVQASGYQFKTDGLIRLHMCKLNCKDVPGIYGRALSGEVIVEYSGGRAVLKNKPFRVSDGGARPLILAREPDVFADAHLDQGAVDAKLALAEELKTAMDAFKASDFAKAQKLLTAILDKSPTEKIVPYYLGLCALELKDNPSALRHLQRYTRDDPEAAASRGVSQLVTLLLTEQLQNEVKDALLRENVLTNEKPEPNTIAVQAFTNRGDPNYEALAKGIAAMVITDLSKVPGLKVLERQKVQKLMDEIKLSESGLVDQSSMLKVGRMMRAEKIFVGSFGVQP